MAFTKANDYFFKEFSAGGVDYRIEFIPYSNTSISDAVTLVGLTENELPDFSIYADVDFEGGFEAGIALGCPEAVEFIVKINPNAFTGDFSDVFSWILSAGEAAAVDYCNYFTNRWRLKADGVVIFDGFQNPTGVEYTEKINTEYSEIEIKALDFFRSILSDTNIADIEFLETDYEDYSPQLLCSDYFTPTSSNVDVLISSLTNTASVFENGSVGETGTLAKMVKFGTIYRRIGERILKSTRAKFRLPALILTGDNYEDIFNGDFLYGFSFYKTEPLISAGTNKGAGILNSDIEIAAVHYPKATDTEVFDTIFEDGIFAFENAYDLLNFLAENFAKYIELPKIAQSGDFPITIYIRDAHYLSKITDSNITNYISRLNDITLDYYSDSLAMASVKFNSMSDGDTEEYINRENGTILRQNSYEIEEIIMNQPATVENEPGLASSESGLEVWLPPSSSKLNFLYYKATPVDVSWDISVSPTNSVGYSYTGINTLSVVYSEGSEIARPAVVDQIVGSGDVAAINGYLREKQESNGLAIIWGKIINSLYGISAKPAVLTCQVSGEFFTPNLLYRGVEVDFSDFSDKDNDARGIKRLGRIFAIEGFDVKHNLYTVKIILNQSEY